VGIGTIRRYRPEGVQVQVKPKLEYTKEDVEELLRQQAVKEQASKLAEVKQEVEIKPIETKSVEIKPIETKSVEIKPIKAESVEIKVDEYKPIVDEPKRVGRPPKFIIKTPETKPTE
jgi:hypothetical protein